MLLKVLLTSLTKIFNMQVYYNNANDCNYSLTKIQTLLPVLVNTEFVAIALSISENAICANPHPRHHLVQAHSVGTGTANQPARVTHLGHWAANSGYQTVNWYRAKWNQYIVLGCGARIYFNDVLDQLT